MNEHSIRYLNDLNRAFYAAIADDFDATRGAAWPGWARLLPLLPSGDRPLSVYDVGCGNGRFGVFLAGHLGARLRYHGVDNNPALLERARAALTPLLPDGTLRLDARDLVEDADMESERYDLVALFGLLHHIPGGARRRALVRALAAQVALGGLLAFACWRFYEYERFRERVAPWPDGVEREPGDYLLDWRRGVKALRYCHYVDDTEQAALAAASGLVPVATYRADGQGGAVNAYTILKRG